MENFQNKAKIVKVSKVIRSLLFAGIVLWAIGIPVVVLQSTLFWIRPPAIAPVTALELQGSLVLVMSFTFLANLRLFRFFDRLQNGFLFDAKTVVHLNAAGKWSVVLWLFEVLHHQIALGVSQTPDDWAWNSGALVAGLILIFFAWLLKEAQGLQEEQELTV